MEKQKVLIADPSEEFRSALYQAMTLNYHVKTCTSGTEALELLHSFLPDVLILDMMLPGLDGITLLQKAADEGICPAVLGVTRYASDYVIHAAQSMRVGYLMLKPCQTDAVLRRVADLAGQCEKREFDQPETRSQVNNVLLKLGFSTKLKGYGYLREAVLIMANDPQQMLTKEIYPVIARQSGGNSKQVERSIRHAIEKAWEHRPEQVWQTFFPMENLTRRPTNGDVISCLANEMLLASGE